jgi:hypothetical protein
LKALVHRSLYSFKWDELVDARVSGLATKQVSKLVIKQVSEHELANLLPNGILALEQVSHTSLSSRLADTPASHGFDGRKPKSSMTTHLESFMKEKTPFGGGIGDLNR